MCSGHTVISEGLDLSGPQRRRCFWLDETCVDPGGKGFIPSIVVENEPGHTPLAGDPKRLQAPWVWGPSLEEAQRQVEQANAEMGLSKQDALEIVVSSLGAQKQLVVVFTDSGTYAPLGVARIVEVDDAEGFENLTDEERNTMALLHGRRL